MPRGGFWKGQHRRTSTGRSRPEPSSCWTTVTGPSRSSPLSSTTRRRCATTGRPSPLPSPRCPGSWPPPTRSGACPSRPAVGLRTPDRPQRRAPAPRAVPVPRGQRLTGTRTAGELAAHWACRAQFSGTVNWSRAETIRCSPDVRHDSRDHAAGQAPARRGGHVRKALFHGGVLAAAAAVSADARGVLAEQHTVRDLLVGGDNAATATSRGGLRRHGRARRGRQEGGPAQRHRAAAGLGQLRRDHQGVRRQVRHQGQLGPARRRQPGRDQRRQPAEGQEHRARRVRPRAVGGAGQHRDVRAVQGRDFDDIPDAAEGCRRHVGQRLRRLHVDRLRLGQGARHHRASTIC